MSLSRQQRRAQLKQSIESVARAGIDLDQLQSGQLWAIIGLTRILIDILGGKSATRASDAAKRAHEFFEISLKRNPSDHTIDCAKGCAFCCRLRVTALAPEVFHVANHVRAQLAGKFPDVLAEITAADRGGRGLSARERPRAKVACGLLAENSCSVYASRPSSCRGLTSISVATCERGYNGEAVEVLTPAVWSEIRQAHNQALWAALVASDLPAHSYELNHAMLVALQNPDAERRWLAGEDVFAEVSCDPLLGGDDKVQREKLVAFLMAGAAGREFPNTD